MRGLNVYTCPTYLQMIKYYSNRSKSLHASYHPNNYKRGWMSLSNRGI